MQSLQFWVKCVVIVCFSPANLLENHSSLQHNYLVIINIEYIQIHYQNIIGIFFFCLLKKKGVGVLQEEL